MWIVLFSLGMVTGLIAKAVSVQLICNRKYSIENSKIFNSIYSNLFWAIITGICFLIIGVVFNGDLVKTVECLFIFTICLSISAVDVEIRRIPNELLIILLLIKVVMLIMNNDSLGDSIFGMLVAGMVLMFPARFGKSIGMGDVKLSMIIGFYLGVVGFVQTMAIMGICLFVYWLYLYITRKGTLKTSAALGPYISIGFIVTMCLSLPIKF